MTTGRNKVTATDAIDEMREFVGTLVLRSFSHHARMTILAKLEEMRAAAETEAKDETDDMTRAERAGMARDAHGELKRPR